MRVLIICLVFISFVVFAQQNDKKKKETPKKTTKTEVEAVEEAKEFIYDPGGRRDPFWDLLRGTDEASIRKRGGEGIAGLEIDQLELEGIVRKSGEYIALFKGPDSKPYDVKVGQNVYDGEIIEITANTVVFKKILTIALAGNKEKTIVKRLNPEKENEK